MHPFIEWIDAGRPSSIESYNSSHEWLENADMESRGATISEFIEWHRNRPSIYKDFNRIGDDT